MNGVVYFTLRQLSRNLRRSLAILGGLTLAVAMAVSTLLYVSGSAGGLTETALRPLAVDLVARGTNDRVDPQVLAQAYRSQAGVRVAEPLVAADFASLSSSDGARTTPPGRVFAVSPEFVRLFPFVMTTGGAFSADGILLSEASAVRLGVRPGDSVRLAISGEARTYRVAGLLNSAAAEPLFAGGDANFEGEYAVVPDVVIMPYALYRADSSTTIAPTAPGARAPADAQVYLQIDRSQFAGDPPTAQRQIDSFARKLERLKTGQVRITNNDSAALSRAMTDVLGAKVLFIFLGLPGIAVAGFLAYAASQVFREESRREVGLLRARGAGPRQVYFTAAVAAALLGAAGSLLGSALGAVAAVSAVGPGSIGAAQVVNAMLIAIPIALAVAFLAVMLPTILGLRREINDERRVVQRGQKAPAWQRFGLDMVALVAAMLFFAVTLLAGGFKPTNAEGESITLAFYVFLGPLFLWIGVTLFSLRYVGRLMPLFIDRAGRLFRFDGFGNVAARDLARRPQLASLITVVVALTLAFGVSLLAFTNTFAQERLRDSRYAVGSDIRVTLSSAGTNGPAAVEPAFRRQPVAGYSGFLRDTNALVGSRRQTVYGVDVASFRTTAYLPDSFFANGSAARTLDALAATPNGVLVSREEAAAFNIVLGDPLFVRLSSADPSGYRDVELKVVGIIKYFPTSSQDSDFIINRAAMAAAAGRTDGRSDIYLVKVAPGAVPGDVSRAIQGDLAAGTVARFEDVQTAARVNESSLTNLNVTGLGGIQQTFGYALVGGALLAFVATLISTRMRDLSTMRALGASLGQVRRFVAVQAAAVAVASLVVGVPVGLALGWVLVRLLAIIFPIPVEQPVLISRDTLLFVGVSLATVVLAILAASAVLGRTVIGTKLRDQ